MERPPPETIAICALCKVRWHDLSSERPADVLLRGHMADLFDNDTNFVPDLTFDGAIVILDLPIKVYGQAGLYVQAAFTTCGK